MLIPPGVDPVGLMVLVVDVVAVWVWLVDVVAVWVWLVVVVAVWFKLAVDVVWLAVVGVTVVEKIEVVGDSMDVELVTVCPNTSVNGKAGVWYHAHK